MDGEISASTTDAFTRITFSRLRQGARRDLL